MIGRVLSRAQSKLFSKQIADFVQKVTGFWGQNIRREWVCIIRMSGVHLEDPMITKKKNLNCPERGIYLTNVRYVSLRVSYVYKFIRYYYVFGLIFIWGWISATWNNFDRFVIVWIIYDRLHIWAGPRYVFKIYKCKCSNLFTFLAFK